MHGRSPSPARALAPRQVASRDPLIRTLLIRRRLAKAAAAFLCTALLLLIFRAAEAELFPAMTLRESHLATIVFVSLVASVVAYAMTAGLQRAMASCQQAEEALRAEFGSLVEHAPLGIFRSTPQGRLLAVNPALASMLGYGEEREMQRLDLGRDVYADPAAPDRVMAQLQMADTTRTEVEWKRRGGEPITVRLNLRTVRSSGGEIECHEGLVEDVTQQRSLENQLRQAQRLEAVARLAGFVAHDFNNVLTAITGRTELLLQRVGPDGRMRAELEQIRMSAQRAAGLTGQLLAFSRKQALQTRVLDLNAVIRTLEKMLRRLIGEDIRLAFAPGADLGAVRADPGQIEQVILNLVVNSRDAMPNGGRLTIETANVDFDEACACKHAGATPGSYVLLAVSDTGVGMDAEVRSHLFEPFFTTKEQGKGTGLGLSTVYGIVTQSGGNIWVYSEPGRGTAIKIYFPRVDEPVEAPSAAPSSQPAGGGRETVLVAEDDASVREVLAEALTQLGYRVLRAPDGQAALEIARAQAGTIDLLVTDIVMPGMTGQELAQALATDRPGVGVLFISGYTDDAVVRHGILSRSMPYLQKPFNPGALAFKVREALDARNSG